MKMENFNLTSKLVNGLWICGRAEFYFNGRYELLKFICIFPIKLQFLIYLNYSQANTFAIAKKYAQPLIEKKLRTKNVGKKKKKKEYEKERNGK
jgi:hypothetical protein